MPKGKSRTIKSRNEKISSRKKKGIGKMISDAMKPSKSFKEAAGIVGTVLGPGKVFKGAKTIKQAADAVRIKKAAIRAKALSKAAGKGKDAGKERIKKALKGNRATTKSPGRATPAAVAKIEKGFSKSAMDKALKAKKQERVTKEASKKLTAKRKAQQKRMDKKK
jgi:hypothetical protein